MKLFSKIKQKHDEMTVERRAKWFTLYSIIALVAYITSVCFEPAIFFVTILLAVLGVIVFGVYRGILACITPKKTSRW
jgi:phosphatidylglycerophosphate synthase